MHEGFPKRVVFFERLVRLLTLPLLTFRFKRWESLVRVVAQSSNLDADCYALTIAQVDLAAVCPDPMLIAEESAQGLKDYLCLISVRLPTRHMLGYSATGNHCGIRVYAFE